MIRPTMNGYKVTSEHGKNLSKGNLTLDEAKKRLTEIEYFKNKGKKLG